METNRNLTTSRSNPAQPKRKNEFNRDYYQKREGKVPNRVGKETEVFRQRKDGLPD